MHIQRRKKIKRRPLNSVDGSNLYWQMDAAYAPKEINGFKYFLLVIDAFSRMIFTRPLKALTGKEGKEAFLDIVNKDNGGQLPRNVVASDDGSEMTTLIPYLRKKGIYWSQKYGANKAFLAERYIKTIKRKIYQALRGPKILDENWVKLLPIFTENINKTPKEAIGNLRPVDVHGSQFDPIVREAKRKAGISTTQGSLEDQKQTKIDYEKKPRKFSVGDYVFANFDKKEEKNPFFRSFDTQRGVLYKIREVRSNVMPPLIYLETLKGHKIKRAFYPGELEKSVPPTDDKLFIVDDVLDTRTKDGKKEVLVKWKFYGPEYNTVS